MSLFWNTLKSKATKQWAGVVADYFKPRWEVFIRELEIALQEGRPFNKTTFETTVFSAVEEPFTYSTKLYSDVPLGIKSDGSMAILHYKTLTIQIGDSISMATALHDKWRKVYQSYNGNVTNCIELQTDEGKIEDNRNFYSVSYF